MTADDPLLDRAAIEAAFKRLGLRTDQHKCGGLHLECNRSTLAEAHGYWRAGGGYEYINAWIRRC